MRDAVVVDAVRIPIGKGKPTGSLAPVHPVGLLGHTLHAVHARGARLALQTMCEAGGLANATVLERL